MFSRVMFVSSAGGTAGPPAPTSNVLTMMPEKKHYSYTNLADTPQVSGNGHYVHTVSPLSASSVSAAALQHAAHQQIELPFARLKMSHVAFSGDPREGSCALV